MDQMHNQEAQITDVGAVQKKRKQRIIAGSILLLVLLTAAILLFCLKGKEWWNGTPTLSFHGPQTVEASNREEFTVDLVLSDLPDYLYPAASVAIQFDKNKLEFTGVKMGTMMIYDDCVPEEGKEAPLAIPTWSCNPDVANRTGEIKAMYLDMTAEKNAYGKDGFDREKKNVPLRLGFKLKDSVTSGETLSLTFTDAVFATPNGDIDGTSLSMNTQARSLQVENGTIRLS